MFKIKERIIFEDLQNLSATHKVHHTIHLSAREMANIPISTSKDKVMLSVDNYPKFKGINNQMQPIDILMNLSLEDITIKQLALLKDIDVRNIENLDNSKLKELDIKKEYKVPSIKDS